MNNKKIQRLFIIFLLVVSIALADDGSNAKSAANYTELYNNDNSNFDLRGLASGGVKTDETINIRATKEIMPSDKKNSPDIKLTLEMPPKPAKLDIVLAMDTSGSMVQHYQDNHPNVTYLDWASNAIIPIIDKYPEARVSIVSWDDDDELGDLTTRFYNAFEEQSKIENELNKLSLECLETDHTVYSIGVKRAVQALDRYPPADPYNTARIIIFVTGLSEFMAEPKNASSGLTLQEQLANAKRSRNYGTDSNFNGYQIYTVRIGIDPRFKWQFENLSRISQDTSIEGQPVIKEPIDLENIENLDTVIRSILSELKSRPIAYNVEVIDTLYPYLEYLGSDNNKQIPVNKANNLSDGSTTLIWHIGTMEGEDIWTATIHTRLVLNLPVEVSSNRTEFKYVIANTTPVSEVRYRWMTGYEGIISLPEGKIILSSGNPFS